MDVPPMIVDGRTLIPVRGFFEAMNSKVVWDGDTKTATVKSGRKTIKLQIDSTKAYVNGKAYELDVPARIVDGRMLIPVRFISEALGYKVGWDGEMKKVIIEK